MKLLATLNHPNAWTWGVEESNGVRALILELVEGDGSRNARPHLSGGFQVKRPSFGALFLGLIPFFAMCFSVSAWDRVYPMVLGLPFNLFWLLSWMVFSSVCI